MRTRVQRTEILSLEATNKGGLDIAKSEETSHINNVKEHRHARDPPSNRE